VNSGSGARFCDGNQHSTSAGSAAFGILSMSWSVTLARGVRGVIDGSVFQPH
jgi:hypothetical protein